MFAGIDIAPYWRVLPPNAPDTAPRGERMRTLRLVQSEAFGLGTHPTTQLCMLALGAFHAQGFHPAHVLDFGAGTGILSVAAATLGARAEAIEIDPLAIIDAKRNAALNGVGEKVTCRETLSEPARSFELVFANILSVILLHYAAPLCARVSLQGRLVLSGLVATDVPSLRARYAPLLPARRAQVYERGEWRALVFAP